MFDVEITNRCNAECRFCPRSETPHEGLMSDRTFDKVLARILEFRELMEIRTGSSGHGVSFCGMGDVLVHPAAAQRVRMVRDAGIGCQLNTNGGNLDERTGMDLLDAGLQKISINAGAIGADYVEIYGIPFERTRDNIARFVEMAEDRCEVVVVLVDDHGNDARLDEVERFWRDLGVREFRLPDYNNRGGALERFGAENFLTPRHQARAHGLLQSDTEFPRCATPFVWLFISYDGTYNLCSSDWRKESSHGDVFTSSVADSFASRLQTVRERSSPCRTCSLDPTNQIAQLLHVDEPDAAEEQAVQLIKQWSAVTRRLDELKLGASGI